MSLHKVKTLYAISLCLLFFSGCAVLWKENGKAGNPDSGNDEIVSTSSSQISDADKETDADKWEDAWGLDDIMELFDIWEWQPSSDPTSLGEIADRAGYSQEYIEGQIENAEKALMMLPKVKAGDTVISFYTEESEKQFLSIEWNDYVFQEAKADIFSSDNRGLWGHSYLRNSLQEQMEERSAVFVSFYYQFEPQRLEILEIAEAPQKITDYACILDYEDNGQKVFMCKEEGIRLLDPAAELNPYENVFPIPGLKEKELEQYIALVFLDIVRDTHNLDKYEKVLSDESLSLLWQLEGYYEKPEEIYDFVKFWESGQITITSQFQPSLWGNLLIDIDIWFVYDMETGRISVKEGQFTLAEKP